MLVLTAYSSQKPLSFEHMYIVYVVQRINEFPSIETWMIKLIRK